MINRRKPTGDKQQVGEVMKGRRKKPKRKNNSSSNIAMKLQLGALIIAVATLLSSVFFTSKPPVEREPLLSVFTSHSPVEREPLLSVSTSHSPVVREPDTHCSDHKNLMPFLRKMYSWSNLQ